MRNNGCVASSERPSPVQSVDRALEILEHLAEHGECRVTDLAAHLGVHKSTAFRLLGALEARIDRILAEDLNAIRLRRES